MYLIFRTVIILRLPNVPSTLSKITVHDALEQGFPNRDSQGNCRGFKSGGKPNN